MSGIWEQAFGIKYLAFGNIAVSIAIMPGVTVTEFGKSIVKVSLSIIFLKIENLYNLIKISHSPQRTRIKLLGNSL